MEEKVIKIKIPEGYEIDKEKSTFEKIVFKLKPKKIVMKMYVKSSFMRRRLTILTDMEK